MNYIILQAKYQKEVLKRGTIGIFLSSSKNALRKIRSTFIIAMWYADGREDVNLGNFVNQS